MAPNTWKTSSPAAEEVSIFSSRLSRATPQSLQMFDDGEEFREGSAESVEANDRQGVALARIGQKFLQAWPVHRFAGADVGEHPDRADLFEAHDLAGDVLIASADAGIAEYVAHEFAVSQTLVLWTRRPAPLSGPETRPQNTSLYAGLSMIPYGLLWTVGGDHGATRPAERRGAESTVRRSC